MATPDVRKVMENIKAEARLRKAQQDATEPVRYGPETEASPTYRQIYRLDLEPPQHAPTLQIKEQGYHIQDFLQYHDRQFVINAYAGILKRLPEPEGLKHWLSELRNGRMTKTDVLCWMRYSPEGRAKDVKVKGIRLERLRRSLNSVPLVGYVFRLLTGIFSLPSVLKNIEDLDVRNDAYFFCLKDDLLKVQMKLNDIIGQALFMQDFLAKRKADIARLGDRILQETGKIGRALESMAALKARRDKLMADLKDDTGQIPTKTRDILREIHDLELNIMDRDRRWRLLWEEARKRLPEPVSETRIPDALYVSFEEKFRGSRQDIKQRLEVYLPYIKEAQSRTEDFLLLDVGCGRGEWLELLKEQDILGLGVDSNRVMINQCEGYGLDVLEGDMIESLRDFPSVSLGAVTAFHLVEHLPFDILAEFLDEIARVLKPGGIAIVETPNPENILVGAYSFHLDPTHRKPLPAQTIEFLAKASGFSRVEIKYLHPYGEEFKFKDCDSELAKRFEDYFYGARDYAMIAYR